MENGSSYKEGIRLDQLSRIFYEKTQALLDKLESRIPGTLLGLLWWCFILFKALLGFTWVFVLRHNVCSLDPHVDLIIHAPTFSFNEIEKILEGWS